MKSFLINSQHSPHLVPSRVTAVDFETYYAKDYSVKELGTHRYVNDPRFDAYLVAIFGEHIRWVGHPKDAPWGEIDGETWVSHNAQFDMAVFNRLQELGTIHTDSGPCHWHDTAALASYLQAPRNLAGASKELIGMELNKAVRAQMEGVAV